MARLGALVGEVDVKEDLAVFGVGLGGLLVAASFNTVLA
jgi:hypothetical protein